MNDIFDEKLKSNRKKNTLRMTITGFVYVIASIVFPFLIRTLMIYKMGDDYAGINTVLLSIISMLNMTELGLGSVIVYFLYDPIARGDIIRTGAFLNVLKKVYGFIALFVLMIGIAVIPFLKIIINDDIPYDANIYASYLLFLSSSLVLYLGFPEADMLFNAYQRGDIVNNIKLISSIIAYMLQIVSIVILHSFVCYFAAILIQSVVIICFRYYEKKQKYPNIVVKGDITSVEKTEIKKRVLSVVGHQMDEKFLSSIDNVILSYFCGLSVVTIYGNYMYVVSALGMFFNVLFNSITLTMGNALVTDSKESNYNRFRKIMVLNSALVAWMFICMLCIYSEFMNLWMGNRLFPVETVILFCLYFFVMQIRRTVITFKNANGMWWEDRYKPYVSMIVNLLLDIVLVNIIGVNGALISSILSIALIEIPWESKVLIRDYFGKKIGIYYCEAFKCLIVCVVGGVLSYRICMSFSFAYSIINIIVYSFLCTIVFVFFFLVLFFKNIHSYYTNKA